MNGPIYSNGMKKKPPTKKVIAQVWKRFKKEKPNLSKEDMKIIFYDIFHEWPKTKSKRKQ